MQLFKGRRAKQELAQLDAVRMSECMTSAQEAAKSNDIDRLIDTVKSLREVRELAKTWNNDEMLNAAIALQQSILAHIREIGTTEAEKYLQTGLKLAEEGQYPEARKAAKDAQLVFDKAGLRSVQSATPLKERISALLHDVRVSRGLALQALQAGEELLAAGDTAGAMKSFEIARDETKYDADSDASRRLTLIFTSNPAVLAYKEAQAEANRSLPSPPNIDIGEIIREKTSREEQVSREQLYGDYPKKMREKPKYTRDGWGPP